MKKVLSLVLVLTLVLALAVPAFATDDKDVTRTGLSITISGTLKDTTYTVYKILNLKTYDAALGAYRYVCIDEDGSEGAMTWAKLSAMSATVQDGTTYTVAQFLKRDEVANEDGVKYVTWVNPTTKETTAAQTLAQVLKANAEAGKIPAATTPITTTADGETVTFTGLTPGYYLVVSTSGVLAGMDTAQEDAAGNLVVTINEKNVRPTLDKDVLDKPEDTWGDSNDANIGDTVNFRIVVSAQKGAEKYIVHDKMSAGLTFNNDVVIKQVAGGEGKNLAATVEGTLVAGVDYNVTTSVTDECTFEIVFTKAYLDKVFGTYESVAKDLVITYTAELNQDAVVFEAANTNDAKLTYGNKTTNDTGWSHTDTYTFDFNIHKYGTNSSEDVADQKAALADAHFSLFKEEACTNVIYFDDMGTVDGKNAYRVNSDATAEDAEKKITKDMVTPASGDIRVYGLDEGVYYLKETQAPAGYNLVDAVMKVAIDAEGKVTFLDAEESAVHGTIRVENKSGAELPSTGGIGTTIFYVIGGLLVCAAVVLLVTKKKVGSN